MDLHIPYWHPLVVHFPIALLLVGALAAVAYAIVGRSFWRGVTLLAVAAGAAGAGAAVYTGESIYDGVEGTPVVEALVERHEMLGEWALWVGVAAAVVLAGATVWARRERRRWQRDPLALRLVVLVLALAAAVLVVLAGHLGGTMVWGVPAN